MPTVTLTSVIWVSSAGPVTLVSKRRVIFERTAVTSYFEVFVRNGWGSNSQHATYVTHIEVNKQNHLQK